MPDDATTLVLTCEAGDTVRIGTDVTLVVTAVRQNRVKLQLDTAQAVRVNRTPRSRAQTRALPPAATLPGRRAVPPGETPVSLPLELAQQEMLVVGADVTVLVTPGSSSRAKLSIRTPLTIERSRAGAVVPQLPDARRRTRQPGRRASPRR